MHLSDIESIIYKPSPLNPSHASSGGSRERFQASCNEAILDTELNSIFQKADEDSCKTLKRTHGFAREAETLEYPQMPTTTWRIGDDVEVR